MQRKSQITIFLILGFIILGSFLLMIHLRQETTKKKLEKEVTATAVDELKLQEVRNYVQTCLDSTFSNGLELITRQGGYIFEYQNGSLISSKLPFIEYNDTNISYHILRPAISPEGIVAPPHLYPCYVADPYNPIGQNCPGPWICEWSGDRCYYRYNHTQSDNYRLGVSGAINRWGLCTYSMSLAGYDCLCTSPPCFYSIQAQLEHYVESQISKCLNFSVFRGFNITIGNSSANVTIGARDVSLDMTLPLFTQMEDYAPSKQQFSFSSKQSIRLLEFYTLVFGMGTYKGLIVHEMKNISFDVVKDGQKLANEFGFFEIEKRKIPINKTTIIIINDTSGVQLNGKQVIFQFAIENRNPAIDYFEQNAFGTYDIFVFRGDDIIIKPDAYDPDEDQMLIKYHGWKTDSPGPDGLYSELGPENIWENSVFYEDKTRCVHPEKGLQEHVCANYSTTDGDYGEHYITVEVIDSSGYKDWQTMKTFVSVQLTPRIETGASGCRRNPELGGGFLTRSAIEDELYVLQGHCGLPPPDQVPPYTFLWAFSTNTNPLGFDEDVTGNCVELIQTAFSADATISLVVEDTNGQQTAAPSINIGIYPDDDGDGFCEGQMEFDSIDNYDNCLDIHNSDQADNYPPGGDGVGDACQDYDGDTENDNTDCNPTDPEMSHYLDEWCGDGKDNNCNTLTDELPCI